MNGAKKPQEMVTENHTVPVPTSAWKEDQKDTPYAQTNAHTKAIIDALPSDSVLK
jgi:hypothetical protein